MKNENCAPNAATFPPVKLLALAAGLLLGLIIISCEAEAPQLGSGHPGWENPVCFSSGCHNRSSTHNSDKDPYQCASCHGNNGAPDGHDGDTPCRQCHAEVHIEDGFPDPVACQTCH